MVRGNRSKSTDKEKKPAPPRAVVGEVEGLTLGSAGVAVRVGKKRFAIAAAVPGDRVRIVPRPLPPEARRAVMGGELALADRQHVERRGEGRVVAPCQLLSRCGGCALQELAYESQVAQKRAALHTLLQALEVAPEVARAAMVHPLEQSLAYRTKLTMPAGGAAGALRFGFYGRGNFEPLPAEGCPVQHPLTLAALAQTRQLLDAFSVTPTRRGRRGGWLHGLAIRVDPPSGGAELTLVGGDANLPGGQDLIAALGALPLLRSVHLSINPSRSSYLLGDEFVHLAGAKRMRFCLAGLSLSLSPGSFLQTCHQGAERLIERVLALLPERFEMLADLYGGVGIFARAAASRWQRATVVEANPHAVGDLRRAMQRKQAPKVTLVQGRVEEQLPRALSPRPDVVIVDPPRRGCHREVIAALCRIRPSTLIYVACGAEAFARDAAALLAGGLRLDHAEGVDMFPHTTHLELVARFRP